MFQAFQQRRWPLVLLWILIVAAIVAAPTLLPVFRLNQLGMFLSLSIVALGIDLIWGFTGLLSLGQGIFFALGGYAAGMYLQLNSSADNPNGIPEFFSLYGVDQLPFFWEPFHSPVFTLIAIWLIPALLAAVLGNLVFRNRIKGVYFSILTQAALLVFFNFFNGQQKLINGTNGLKTDVTELCGVVTGDPQSFLGLFRLWIGNISGFFGIELPHICGQMVGSAVMQRYFFWFTAIVVILAWLFVRRIVRGRFGDVLIAIRDDEPRLRFTGFNPTLFKTIVFAIAGGLAGIGGALFTVQSGIISPQEMSVPKSIEMVIWVAVGGRGTLVGAIFGAVVIQFAESFVSEVWPQSWLFFQGGLFILVVTALPEGVIGWFKTDGPRNLLSRVGLARRLATYPQLEIDGQDEVQP